jgi:hypothetical protein
MRKTSVTLTASRLSTNRGSAGGPRRFICAENTPGLNLATREGM